MQCPISWRLLVLVRIISNFIWLVLDWRVSDFILCFFRSPTLLLQSRVAGVTPARIVLSDITEHAHFHICSTVIRQGQICLVAFRISASMRWSKPPRSWTTVVHYVPCHFVWLASLKRVVWCIHKANRYNTAEYVRSTPKNPRGQATRRISLTIIIK